MALPSDGHSRTGRTGGGMPVPAANGSGILIAHVRPLACSSTLPLSLRYRRSSAGFGGWCGIRTRGTDETVHHLSRVTPSTTRPTNHARLMQDSNLRNLDGSSVFKTGALNLSANQPVTVLGRRAVSGRNVTVREWRSRSRSRRRSGRSVRSRNACSAIACVRRSDIGR